MQIEDHKDVVLATGIRYQMKITKVAFVAIGISLGHII